MLAQSNKVVWMAPISGSLPQIKLSLEDLIKSVAPKLLADKAVIEAKEAEKVLREKEKAEIAEARRKASILDEGGLTESQRLALRSRVLQWETENEWLSVAFVAFEKVDICLCCASISSHLVGVYQLQRLRSKSSTKRFVLWAPEKATNEKIPRQLYTIEQTVNVCPRCAWEQGFSEKYTEEVVVEQKYECSEDERRKISQLSKEVQESQRLIRLLYQDIQSQSNQCKTLEQENKVLKRKAETLETLKKLQDFPAEMPEG